MNKPKSDYTAQVDGDVIFIEDLNLGRMSVTNDIENIIDDLASKLTKPTTLTLEDQYHIIYRDSEGIIDGVLVSANRFGGFYSINETDYQKAKLKIRR